MQHWVCAMRSLVLGTEPLRRTAASLVGGPDFSIQAAVLQRCLSQLQDAQIVDMISATAYLACGSEPSPAAAAAAGAQPAAADSSSTASGGCKDMQGTHSSSSDSGTKQPPDHPGLDRLASLAAGATSHPASADPGFSAAASCDGGGGGSVSSSRAEAVAPWAQSIKADEGTVQALLRSEPGAFTQYVRDFVHSAAVDLMQ